ncbi:MAG: flagellar basal body protein FliL [Candidatus Omnitrophota bacterium]|nr:MAG: flagellar basal body protein FliL [Candidatus Omnitrophota bacterium]
MADPEVVEEGKEAEKPSAKKSPLSMVMVIAIVAIILALVAAFLLVKALTPQKGQGVQPQAEPKQEQVEEGEIKSMGHLYSFENPLIVNLAGTNAERYLKVEMSLEIDSPRVKTELDSRKPQILDLLINILSNKTLDDISTTAGRNMLRQAMIDKINAKLETGRLKNIYFVEFVVQ